MEDFALREVELPAPSEGEVLVENLSLSVDPYMRGRMIDRRSYTSPFQVDEALTGGAIGRVAQSNHPDFAVGDHVESHLGWREAFVSGARGLRKLGELRAPPSAYLGVLGMPGKTAYVGLLDVGALQEGERVFVSGAAGAVGSAVGQIAKIKGCTVVGSAGSPAKVRHLMDDLGFDHAFDYHEGNLEKHIFAGSPQGVDVYFDNVGGDHLQAALNCIAPGRAHCAVRRHLAIQRHRAGAGAEQSRHRHRPRAHHQRLHRLQLRRAGTGISRATWALGSRAVD